MSGTQPRLLLWLSDLGGGGAQRTMLNLAAALPAHGLSVDLVVGQTKGRAREWFDPALVTHEIGGRRLPARVAALARLIRDRAPDAVLSTMMDANVVAYGAARWAKPDAAVILRETNSHRARADLGSVRRALARYVYRRADRVIALSEGVRGELIEDMTLPPDRVVTIPNPVEVTALEQVAARARAEPPPSPLSPGRRRIVAVGRLIRQKGFDVLIEAFARQDKDVELVLVGEGPERAALEAQVARLGISERIHMPGFIADVSPYLVAADLFVLSSRWEGFGHVIVEAMAAGLPVLATDCPYGPADILTHGKTGWLVPPENADELAAAMSLLMRDRTLARNLADSGALAARRYEAANVAGEYAAVIRDAIARRRPDAARTETATALARPAKP